MIFVAAIFTLVFATGVSQSPQTSDPARIQAVEIRGNRRIPTDTIKFNILSKTGDALNMEVIRRDMRTLYALGYFDDIRVDEEETPRGKIIIFEVRERPLIRSVRYEGAKSITNSEIMEKVRERKANLSQESAYDATRVKRAEAVIKAMLAEKGFRNSTVETVTEPVQPNSINLTFKIDEGPKIKIENIGIEGNQVFSDAVVKHAMKLTKETSPLTTFTGKDTYHELKLADDITRIHMLYREHGYVRVNVLDPIVETKPETIYRTFPLIKPTFPWGIPIPFWTKKVDRFSITIPIEENDQYRIGDVKVTGAKQFNELVIRAVLGLIPGQIFNETRLRESFENLKKLYGARGHINFTAVPAQDFDEERKLVNLTINIEEDRQFQVNRITFSGNTSTRDKVIRREIMVEEAQVFNSSLWDVSLLRLNQLGYFDEIKTEDAEIKPDPVLSKVDITLKVKEKGRNSIGFSGGVSGVGGSFMGLSYATNNFLGLGENMSITLQGGTRQSQYQFSFTEPYLFNRPLSAGFSVFSSSFRYDQAREVYGLDPASLTSDLGFENRLNFEQQQKGFSVSGSYPLKVFHRLGLAYQSNSSTTSSINPATQEFFNAVASQEQTSFSPNDTGGSSPFYARRLTPSYTYNTTNNPYNPTRGYSLTTSLEFTGGVLGGNVNFYRPSIEARYFRPINNGRNTLATRFLLSYVQGFNNVGVPFYERSFVGGDFDLRGFDFRSVSPISFITRTADVTDPFTGRTTKQRFDDIVYVGGDTQAIFNFEYRIPLAGPITLAPFADVGNAWVLKKRALLRKTIDAAGHVRQENVSFLPGTNSGVRISTGIELQIVMPVINAPFRLVFALNPSRINRTYTGPVTGTPFAIREPGRDFKFTVGKTF